MTRISSQGNSISSALPRRKASLWVCSNAVIVGMSCHRVYAKRRVVWRGKGTSRQQPAPAFDVRAQAVASLGPYCPDYGSACSFCRFASDAACTTVTGCCRVKFSTVSEGSLICWLLVAACTPPPTPAPAAAPMPAPLPPPARAPIMPPISAPPPTFSAVFLPRELAFFEYWSVWGGEVFPADLRLSSCITTDDCPANLPALFTSTRCPTSSTPAGTACSPSDVRGALSVARNVSPV